METSSRSAFSDLSFNITYINGLDCMWILNGNGRVFSFYFFFYFNLACRETYILMEATNLTMSLECLHCFLCEWLLARE